MWPMDDDGCQVQSQMQLKQLTDLLELVAGALGMAHRRSVFFPRECQEVVANIREKHRKTIDFL